MTEMIEPPFIASAFDIYKARFTENGARELLPVRELEIMQAFYAGATEGLNIAASLEKHPARKMLEVVLKEELEHYSKSNRELAKALGELPVSTKRPT